MDVESITSCGPTLGELKANQDNYTPEQKQMMSMMLQLSETCEQSFAGLSSDVCKNTANQDSDSNN